MYILGVEPILIGPSDPCGPCPLGVGAAHDVSPAPSCWYEGLLEVEGSPLHSEHRGYTHLPGRVYTGYQTTWCAHGPQPAGTCVNITDTPMHHIHTMSFFLVFFQVLQFVLS